MCSIWARLILCLSRPQCVYLLQCLPPIRCVFFCALFFITISNEHDSFGFIHMVYPQD